MPNTLTYPRVFAVGLVQLFRQSPNPARLSRDLLDEALEDFHECALHYRIYLYKQLLEAIGRGDPDEALAIRRAMRRHTVHEQFPERWKLDDLFSEKAYAAAGESLFPKWAAALVQLSMLDDAWEDALLGAATPRRPRLVPCFQDPANGEPSLDGELGEDPRDSPASGQAMEGAACRA